jgi:flagellar assembly factor FliW
VNKNENGITLNLKAPIVVNVPKRLARQIIANGELPVQHELHPFVTPLRMSA